MKKENVVEIYKGEAVAGTWIISQGFKRRHTGIIALCRKYEKELLELSEKRNDIWNVIPFRKVITEGSDKPILEYLLNESQATFLGMMFRAKINNDPVLRFKVGLAKEFIRMKKELIRVASQPQNAQWLETRNAGKETRRIATDTIEKFIDYATEQGSKNAIKYYANISKMENKALFLLEQKYKNLRDALDIHQLSTVKAADMIVMKALLDGMDQGLHYKEIYKYAKQQIESFAGLIGKTLIPSSQLKITQEGK